jgi:glycosyltransferase involved in cell wall biosynthesis
MRILYHHRTLADGAEGIHIHEMVEAFQGLGHSVQVQALAKPSARGSGHTGLLSTIRGSLPPILYETGALGFNVPEYLWVRKVLRQARPDFVYKRHALYDVGAILAAKTERVPLVLEVNRPYSAHSYYDFEPLNFVQAAARLELLAFKQASLIVVVSTPLKSFVLNRGVPPEKVLLTPNGANPARFVNNPEDGDAVRQRLGIGDAMVVGWVGILREWHRVDLLIDAMSTLPCMRLLVIGDGPDKPRLEALTREKGLDSSVVFTGRIPHAEMPRYISALDVAVASDDRTGFASPMKLLEYMSMGKAVVAPSMPNIQDLVTDGVDGLLFTPGDASDLGATLKRLQDDKQLRNRLGRSARLKIETERNWERNASQVIEGLRRVTVEQLCP